MDEMYHAEMPLGLPLGNLMLYSLGLRPVLGEKSPLILRNREILKLTQNLGIKKITINPNALPCPLT
jgi:hypothetical protein